MFKLQTQRRATNRGRQIDILSTWQTEVLQGEVLWIHYFPLPDERFLGVWIIEIICILLMVKAFE